VARLGGVVGVRRRGACVLPPQAGVRGVVGTDGQAGRLPWRRLNGSLGPVRIAISVLNSSGGTKIVTFVLRCT